MENYDKSAQRVQQFEGSVLNGKYQVDRLLGEGSFGCVHKLKRIKDRDNRIPIVVKASKDAAMLFNEIEALNQVKMYCDANKQNISENIAKSVPVNYGRGLLYIE